MRCLGLIIFATIMATFSEAMATSYVFDVPYPYTSFSGQFEIVGDQPTNGFFIDYGFSGGPSITGQTDFFSEGYSTLSVAMSLTGSVLASLGSFGCSEFDFHCSRANFHQTAANGSCHRLSK
jgi:hypothetical protein